MLRSLFFILIILQTSSLLACTTSFCSIQAMSSPDGSSFLNDIDATITKAEEEFPDPLLGKLQKIMLSNMEKSTSYKYLDKNSSDYKGDEFLQYATNMFAAQAGDDAIKEYKKEHDDKMIPSDKWDSEVIKVAKNLERGVVQDQKEKCVEYDCLTPDCRERKEKSQAILARLEQLDKLLKDDEFRKKVSKLRHRFSGNMKDLPDGKDKDLVIFLQEMSGRDNFAGYEISTSLISEARTKLWSSLYSPHSDALVGYQSEEFPVLSSKDIPKSKSEYSSEAIKRNTSKYSLYYSPEVLKYENKDKDFFQADFSIEAVQKKKFYTGKKEEQYNVQMVELDLTNQKMHEDNFFSLNESDFSKKMDIPESGSLNAIHCESSASDVRPTEDHNGNAIKQGEFDYLNFELSANRMSECEKSTMKKYKLSEDKIVKVKSDNLSYDNMLEMQATFYKDPTNKGKVQIFESFKGEHGDGTSGYKSYFCANDSYAQKNTHLCPAQAIKLGAINESELKKHWQEKYGYSDDEFKHIVHGKKYPPYFNTFINQQKKKDPNYKFKISDFDPEQLAQLELIYAKSRYVKVKVFHSPEIIPPEEEIIFTQRICSDLLSIHFSEDFKAPRTPQTFNFQTQKARGNGLYGSPKNYGSVSCGV